MALQQVLIISQRGMGFTVNALDDALQKGKLDVRCMAFSDKNLINCVNRTLLIIIVECGDNEVMHAIANECNKFKKQLFLFGNANEIDAMKRAFGTAVNYKPFVRPVDLDKIVTQAQKVLTYMSNKQGQRKILVVDDNGVMLRTVSGWLEGRYDVALANSAASAFKAIERDKPDLILLDYEMPLCNGSQFMMMLRSDEEYAELPVIFFTSRDDKDTVREVMQLRPKGYILKSTTPEQLIKTLDNYFISAGV